MPTTPKFATRGRPAIDRDLLYEVLRVYLEGEEKKAEYSVTGITLELGTMEATTSDTHLNDRECWMMDTLNPDEPYYGFDKVVQCLQERKSASYRPISPIKSIGHQTNRHKCWSCRSKLGLTPISCKCGYTFCTSHRYPEMHQCPFDFKRENKRKLELLNPALRPDKLVRV